jgi:uncharacterized protein
VTAGIHWLRKASIKGDPKAQYNLGRAYMTGEGARENLLCAQKWLKKAAHNGHARAVRYLHKESYI